MKTLCLALVAAGVCGAQEPKRPSLPGVAHVAVFVSDLDRARAFYKDYLGFAELPVKRRAGAPEQLAVIQVNDRQSIELIAEKPKSDGQLSHIAFYTGDAEAMRVYLASRGIKTPEGVRRNRTGGLSFQVTDPDGHAVEFVQSNVAAGQPATRIQHIGVLTRDAERALEFYGGVLGFRGRAEDKIKAPDGEDALELGLNRKEPTPDRLNIKNHICIHSDDVAKLVSALKAKPAATRFRATEVHETQSGKRVANLYDPDGSRIEFMEQ